MMLRQRYDDVGLPCRNSMVGFSVEDCLGAVSMYAISASRTLTRWRVKGKSGEISRLLAMFCFIN